MNVVNLGNQLFLTRNESGIGVVHKLNGESDVSFIPYEHLDETVIYLTVIANARRYGVGIDNLHCAVSGSIFQVFTEKGKEYGMCLYMPNDPVDMGRKLNREYMVPLIRWSFPEPAKEVRP